MALHIAGGDAGEFSAGGVTGLSVTTLTLSFWFRMPTHIGPGTGTNLRIFRHSGATNGYYEVAVNKSGTSDELRLLYNMQTSGGSGTAIVAPIGEGHRMMDGRWHRILVQHNSDSQVYFWFDGHLVSRQNPFRALGYSGAVTSTIGGNNDFAERWVQVSDLRIHGAMLTNAEVKADARGELVNRLLVGRYLIGANPSGFDYSGRGNHLQGTETALGTGFTGTADPPQLQFISSPRWLTRATRIGKASTGSANATISGALGLSGAATATVGIAATVSGSLALAGAATAQVVVSAAVSGSLGLSGSATATVGVTASVSGGLALSGAAEVTTQDHAHADIAGTLGLSGSAAIGVAVAAAASGTLDLTGSATAQVPVSVTIAGALSLSGAATATVGDPPVGVQVAGALALAGSANATVDVTAAVTGSLGLTGAASIQVGVVATVAGALALTGSSTVAIGEPPRSVVIVGSLGLSGSASAAVSLAAAISGSLGLAGAATARVAIGAQVVGIIALSGAAVAQVPVLAAIAGGVAIGGSSTGTVTTPGALFLRPLNVAFTAAPRLTIALTDAPRRTVALREAPRRSITWGDDS